MHSFPSTASLPINFQYEAAIDVLHRHRRDRCAADACFTLPTSGIQDAARISGGAVRGLLRSKASNALVHPDNLRTPWIEIMGVYTFHTEAGPSFVMAIGISSASLVHKLQMENQQDTSILHNTEKMRLVDKSSALLGQFLSASTKMHGRLIQEHPERAQIRQINSIARIQKLAEPRSKPLNGISEDEECIFFVCDKQIPDFLLEIQDQSGLPILHADGLPQFMTGSLMAWRSWFGTGWLPRLDNFLHDLESALRRKHVEDHVEVNYNQTNRAGSASLAAVAAAKLVTHGWLPQQYSSCSNASVTSGVLKRFIETFGGAMTDGDISIFQLPKFVFPGEEELRVKTTAERWNASWGLFKTPFPQDDVFLYVDHSGYGERETDVLDFEGSDPSCRKLMPLGFLHPLSLGIIRSLLPAVRIDVIGYTAASSTTTRSALLERLLQLVRQQPSGQVHLSTLRDEIAKLRSPSESKPPRTSTHRRCMEIDQLIESYQQRDTPEGSSCADALPKSWPKKLLGRLFAAGSGSPPPDLEVSSSIISLASLLLRIPDDQFKALLFSGSGSAVSALDSVNAIFSLIRLAAKDDPNVRRTQGSSYNHLALRKDMAIMIRDAVKGRLAVPELLADWISKHVRITCVMPLDALHPGLPQMPKNDRPALACSFHSCRLYKHLFGPESVESIEVDLSALLSHASLALTAERGKGRGWLANKISQANELSANMMVRTGHLEDFSYGEILSPKTAKDSRSMLSALPAQLLVRCILSQCGGRDLLANWAGELGDRVAAYWNKDLASSSEEPPSLSSDAASILTVFSDIEGIATAALDCCRSRVLGSCPGKQSNMRLTVYFVPDELRNQFRKPNLMKALGVRTFSINSLVEYEDDDENDDNDDD